MKTYFNGIWKEIEEDIFYSLYIEPSRTAVMTLDMHRGHLGADKDCPAPALGGNEIIGEIDEFTKKCRERGIPVIHVRSVLRKDGADDINGNISAWRILKLLRDGPRIDASQHAIEGSKWIEFCVHVEDGDYVIDGKKRLSAFYPTDLELLLRNLRKDILVVTGALTDCCVLATVIEGANHDFRMIVPKNLTRGHQPYEEGALNIISRYFGLVVDSEELIEQWDK